MRFSAWILVGLWVCLLAACDSSGDDAAETDAAAERDAASPGPGADDSGTASPDSGSDAGGGTVVGTADPVIECGVIVDDADCDTSLRPIVFIHGTFGSATEISNTAQLFGSNGYCQERFVAVEYNSLGGNPAAQLAELIDQVLADTGFDQVDLAGHSQGTGHACMYLSDPARAAKVAHYLNISGGCNGNGVPTLSLSSTNDIGGMAHHSEGDNVTQVTLEQEDHVALAGSKLSFAAMYEYLMGEAPEHTTVQCGADPVILDGKSVTFGDNVPRPGTTIDVYEIDELESPRERGEPVFTITADDQGHFHAPVRRGVRYELKLTAADGTHLGYGYPGPYRRSDYLARLLSASDNPLVAGASTNRITRGPDHAGLVGRYVAGAFRKDWGNSLKIDGQEVLTDDNAPRNASIVGMFLYDANMNGASDLGAVFSGSFLMGTDVFIDTSEPRWLEIEWTNEEGATTLLKVPNWPSSETLASVVLPYP